MRGRDRLFGTVAIWVAVAIMMNNLLDRFMRVSADFSGLWPPLNFSSYADIPPVPGTPNYEVFNQIVGEVGNGRELLVTTASGDTLEGYCLSITLNEIAVTTIDHNIVKIARSSLSRIDMHRAKGHQFSSLVRGMHESLKWSFESLLSPSAPLGIVAVPGTVAWGVVATPFCLLGDLRYKTSGKQEIKLN